MNETPNVFDIVHTFEFFLMKLKYSIVKSFFIIILPTSPWRAMKPSDGYCAAFDVQKINNENLISVYLYYNMIIIYHKHKSLNKYWGSINRKYLGM